MTVRAARIATVLRAALPDLPVTRVRAAGSGDFSRAFWIDDTWIVRVPKHARASAALQREAAVLPALAGALTLAIPVPEHVGLDPSTGFTLVAHRAIRGVPLTPARVRSLGPDERATIAAQLAEFFAQLHGHPVASLRGVVPEGNIAAGYRAERAEIEAAVFPRLSSAVADTCGRMLDALTPAATQGLLHADLYEHHMFLDPQRAALAGIIDFGDMCIDDPDADLRTVLDDFGSAMLMAVLRGESHARARVRFERARTYCVWDALAWVRRQIEAGRSGGVPTCLRAVTRLCTVDANDG